MSDDVTEAPRVVELASPRDTLRVQCDLAAPLRVVFACWVEPALLTRWWPQQAVVEPGAGGAYHLAWPQMGWSLRGHYLVFDMPERLSFTWRWDHDPAEEPERHVAISLAALEDAAGAEHVTTRLLLTHGPYGATPAEQALRDESHLAGWRHFLPRLGALVASLPS